MNSRAQLFHLVRRVEFPGRPIRYPGSKPVMGTPDILPAAFTLISPSGPPCPIAEMFLLDLHSQYTVRESDGGSLKVMASSVSQLIRFCAEIGKQPWDLVDGDFYLFVRQLQTEIRPGRLDRVRDDTTVGRIVDVCIAFFTWIQTSVFVDKSIVGPAGSNPQIRLIEKTYRDRRGILHKKLAYPYSPRPGIPEPKGPMPTAVRDALWNAVETLYCQAACDSKRDIGKAKYIRSRREQMLFLLEASGCRPGELEGLQVAPNSECGKSSRLVLPTLKRRRRPDPLRDIPIDRGVAIEFDQFIAVDRAELLERLRADGLTPAPKGAVFLCSRKGTPLSAASLSRDFSRIVRAAGVTQRACSSMFRHRFITNMVRLHLEVLFEGRAGLDRYSIPTSDYRTILKRVASFTGHGDERSLLPYIDWAWDEMGTFDRVDEAREYGEALNYAARVIGSIRDDITARPSEGKTILLRAVRQLDQLQMRISKYAETRDIQQRQRALMDGRSETVSH